MEIVPNTPFLNSRVLSHQPKLPLRSRPSRTLHHIRSSKLQYLERKLNSYAQVLRGVLHNQALFDANTTSRASLKYALPITIHHMVQSSNIESRLKWWDAATQLIPTSNEPFSSSTLSFFQICRMHACTISVIAVYSPYRHYHFLDVGGDGLIL